MGQFLGILATALSILIAAIVSGLRLKPYMDAGETYTPPTFALYPALIAAAIAIPLGFALRKWQGKTDIDIGPITLSDKQPFMVLWCLLYVTIAVLFFPYERAQPPPPPLPPGQETPATPPRSVNVSLPLSAQNFPGYAEESCASEVCLP
ncbi:MAG: hypothetical protein AB1671_04910 [Thermodesulfobacteriota bacterium]